MPGWRADAVYARVQCQEPKTGLQKVQLYCEDDSLFLSSYYLFMGYRLCTEEREFKSIPKHLGIENIPLCEGGGIF